MVSQGNNIYDFFDAKSPGKAKKRKVFKHGIKLMICLALFLFMYLIISFGTNFGRLYVMQQDVEKIQAQVNELQQKNDELKQELKMAQSDAYVEKMAREKLNLVKPGESRIVPVEGNEQ